MKTLAGEYKTSSGSSGGNSPLTEMSRPKPTEQTIFSSTTGPNVLGRTLLSNDACRAYAKGKWVKKKVVVKNERTVAVHGVDVQPYDLWRGYERFRAIATPYKATDQVPAFKAELLEYFKGFTCFAKSCALLVMKEQAVKMYKNFPIEDKERGYTPEEMVLICQQIQVPCYVYDAIEDEVVEYVSPFKADTRGVLYVPNYLELGAHVLPVRGTHGKTGMDLSDHGLEWSPELLKVIKTKDVVAAEPAAEDTRLKHVLTVQKFIRAIIAQRTAQTRAGTVRQATTVQIWWRWCLARERHRRFRERMRRHAVGWVPRPAVRYNISEPEWEPIDRLWREAGWLGPHQCRVPTESRTRTIDIEWGPSENKDITPIHIHCGWHTYGWHEESLTFGTALIDGWGWQCPRRVHGWAPGPMIFWNPPPAPPPPPGIAAGAPIALDIAYVRGVAAPPVQPGGTWSALWNRMGGRNQEANEEYMATGAEALSHVDKALRALFGQPTRSLVELHPRAVWQGSLLDMDTLLYGRDAQLGIQTTMHEDGAYAWEMIEYIETDYGNFTLTPFVNPVTMSSNVLYSGLRYSLFCLVPAAVSWKADLGALLPSWARPRLEVHKVVLKTSPPENPMLCNVVAPDLDSTYRTIYTSVLPMLPEHARKTYVDMRNAEFANAQRTTLDPVVAAQSITRICDNLKEQAEWPKAYALPKRQDPKTCVSCGVTPPKHKYRWKHRMCEECRKKLKYGAVTWAGAQVISENSVGQVPSCRPGICKKMDRQYPPSKKKWGSVDTTDQVHKVFVKVSEELLYQKGKVICKKWSDVSKNDMEKFNRGVEPSFGLALTGIACSGATPMLSAKTQYNNLKALLGRAFRRSAIPGPRPGIYRWMGQFVDVLLPGFVAENMTLDQWLDSMPSKRRRVLRAAAEEYHRTGWLEKYGKFSAFVKQEMLPDFAKTDTGITTQLEMLDRLIQGPNDVGHIIVGPVVKPLVRRLKKLWDKDGPIFYGSSTPEALHMWLQRLVMAGGSYFWCDYAMYDNTHSVDSWAFMRGLYRESVGDNPDFERVMDAWLCPEGRIGAFKYRARPMNASGRDDTALSNGVLNGFAAYLSACAAWLNKPLMTLTKEDVYSCMDIIMISVCGDDSLGRIPELPQIELKAFCDRMSANIAEFGFEAKLQASSKLYEAVYLGHRPYPTRKGWFWGKTIGRATYKMGWVIDKDQDLMAHMTGIADMHTLCSSHVPVLSDLADKILQLRQGARRTPVTPDQNKPWEWAFQSNVRYDDLTMAAVCDIYSARRTTTTTEMSFVDVDATMQELKQLIKEIEAIDTLPYVLDNQLWRRMVWVDDL